MTVFEHKDDCRYWDVECDCRKPHEQTWVWNDDRRQVEVADDRLHVIVETDGGCYGPRGNAALLIAQAPAMARLLLKLEWAGNTEGIRSEYCPLCPMCRGSKHHEGHRADCELAAVLHAAGVLAG